MAGSPQATPYLRLAERIQARDAAAEEEFFKIFQPRIRGFGIAHTHDAALADDLAQEVVWAAASPSNGWNRASAPSCCSAWWTGLTPEEIAGKLNITAETVGKRKSRALRRLWAWQRQGVEDPLTPPDRSSP